jgi:hypothetical protein
MAQQVNPPFPAAGGTCAGLAGDVIGTCGANAIKPSVGLTGAPTTPTGTVGDASTQISNDAFVAGVVASINPAVSVQAATVGVLSNTPTYSNGTAGVGATLTAGTNGALTIDGYTVLLNDRVLIKNQASTFQNGIYTLTTLGTGGVPYVLTRATDYNATTNINYTGTIPVLQGSTLANTGWNGPTNIVTVGTDAIAYTQAASGNAGGPPGGNVKATGNLATGDIITGAGGKTIQDSGKTLTNFAKRGLYFSIGDPANSSALTTSSVTYLASVPFACTISAYNLAIDAGTITVKFWKIATGTAIPTVSNVINTSGVGIATGTAIHSATVSDFTTTAVAANDIMAMAVTAVATAKFVNGVLECDQ